MTFSRFEHYGGSNHIILDGATISYTIGYKDFTRVLYFTEISAFALGTLNLPDATRVRHPGFMYYLVINDTSVDLEIRLFGGGLFTTISPGNCGAIGLEPIDDSDGPWFLDGGQCVHELPPEPGPPTVSFGGAFGNDDTWLYAHVNDVWTKAADVPTSAQFAQAVNVLQLVGGDFRSYWKHLTTHYEFSFGADTHTALNTASVPSKQTGSARLRDGDGVDAELYLSWGELDVFFNLPTIYHPVTDVWTNADLLQTDPGNVIVRFARCVTSAGQSETDVSLPAGIWLAYMVTAEPVIDADLAENPYFWGYQGTNDTHTQLPMSTTTLSPNRWQTSMVNLGEAVHLVGGSFIVRLPNIPEDATARHLRYSGGFNGFWVARPQLPEPTMGMGISIIAEIPDKFTIGMGQHEEGVIDSDQHYEYDELTQSYISRSIANWFEKFDQEGSWCVAGA